MFSAGPQTITKLFDPMAALVFVNESKNPDKCTLRQVELKVFSFELIYKAVTHQLGHGYPEGLKHHTVLHPMRLQLLALQLQWGFIQSYIDMHNMKSLSSTMSH